MRKTHPTALQLGNMLLQDNTLYHHSFNDAQKPASKANPQGISLNVKGEVLCCRKIVPLPTPTPSSSQNSISKAVGIMRKISTTQSIDGFHQAASLTYNFNPNNVEQQEAAIFTSKWEKQQQIEITLLHKFVK